MIIKGIERSAAPHASAPPKLRGLALKNDFEVLRDLYGASVHDATIRALPPRYRELAERGFLPNVWYDDAITVELVRVLAFEPYEQVRFGVAIGHRTVTRWHRFLARIAKPEGLLARAPGMWSYWRDTGAMFVERHGKGAADVVVVDNPVFADEGNAELYAGASGYMVKVAGGRAPWIRVERFAPGSVRALVRWNDAPRDDAPGWHDIDAVFSSLPPAFVRGR